MLLTIMAAGTLAPVDDEAWLILKDRIERAPQPVATFIERRTGCNHWNGKGGGGEPGREKQIERARKQLGCDQIDTDERSLRKRYRNLPDVLQLLNDTEDLMPW
jgi:hypothetical protein